MTTKQKQSIWKAYRFPIILLTGIVLGSLIGIQMGERASIFKPLGDLFLNGMFTIVVPLVFLSISSAVSNMANLKRLGKILGNLFLTFAITGLIAAFIMIVVVNVFPPAE
ncbi:MAG: dicarboxylate/amino acid:cation symporter, partial [Anaeromicrobium sp.]|uniref:cation:dicarboxylate symporter family transporter n=1 Tax=Anaeromicrobium sp. TaxID=1929132 RepID=UPI0025DE74BD